MKANVNGIELFYEKRGKGSPLLLLHGNGEDLHIFDELSEKLKDDFAVYCIDSRNHGLSTKTNNYSYDVMAEDIYYFIRELKLAPAGIAGFSDGAICTLLLALKHREAIKKMALLGVNLKPEDFTPESLEFVKDMYIKTKDPLFKLMLEQPDIELNELAEIKTPALIIAAENDIYKSETFTNIAAALVNSELMIMKGHGHDSYISHNDILYPDFVKFFRD
ncbi:MAG: alpha/beta hydrolase [Syntrophomonadaceae bacterium]|jgi:pimeloyl-ACP methyl ester carboxylesterase|nr:alpha/beta hydrolase [Syntrophomonadaceae bacterium]